MQPQNCEDMAKTKTKKNKAKQKAQTEEQRIYESSEALQQELSRSQEFVNKNKNLVTGALVVFVLIVASIFFYRWTIDNQDKEAQEQLFPAVFYFEKDSLSQAMQGDGNYTDGFEAIADEYSMTDAGNLASFYAGSTALQNGEFDKAIEYLKGFSSNDYLVQARAYCLTGDAYMEKEEFSAAVGAYKKAVNHYPNDQFTPTYMLKLALAHEQAGNADQAASVYQDIIAEYENSTEAGEAKKYLSLVQN